MTPLALALTSLANADVLFGLRVTLTVYVVLYSASPVTVSPSAFCQVTAYSVAERPSVDVLAVVSSAVLATGASILTSTLSINCTSSARVA